MKVVLVSQRVEVIEAYSERRDALDQRWYEFLGACNILPIPIGNGEYNFEAFATEVGPTGILLTGGNTLAKYGGDAPERDTTELSLINFARKQKLPLLGVCRGMQMIQDVFGIELTPIEGHVSARQNILVNGETQTVNSYHDFGTKSTSEELEVWAEAEDGTIKAIKHPNEKILGIMWHPERMEPFRKEDIKIFQDFFEAEK